VIETFRHKGLKRLHDHRDRSKLPPEMAERIRDILTVLDSASEISAIDLPTMRLHQLKGDLLGYWAVTVRANWRIIFRFENGNAYDVDFIDYH
jgi:proteic killer suppression protein